VVFPPGAAAISRILSFTYGANAITGKNDAAYIIKILI
jgi:hypothetical protein